MRSPAAGSLLTVCRPATVLPVPPAALSDLVPGEVFYDLQERRVVFPAPTFPLHRQEHLVHDGRHGEGYAVLAAGRQRYAEVLVVQLGAEAGVEGVGEELLALDLHHLVAREAAAQDVQDLLRRYPARRSEEHT